MLPLPSPRTQARCHLALAFLWCASRAASTHGWWTSLAEPDRHATVAMALGLIAAWLSVGLLATLVWGLGAAGWPLRGATLLAVAAPLGGGDGVDALDVAWLCLATPAACWILIPTKHQVALRNQAIS